MELKKNQNKIKKLLYSFLFLFVLGSGIITQTTMVNAMSFSCLPTDSSVRITIPETDGSRNKYEISIYQDGKVIQKLQAQCYGYSDTYCNVYDLKPKTRYKILVRNKNTNRTREKTVTTKSSGTYRVFNNYKSAGKYVYNHMTKFKDVYFYVPVDSETYIGGVIDEKWIRPYDRGRFSSAKAGYYNESIQIFYQTVGRKIISGKKHLLLHTEYHFVAGLKQEKKLAQKTGAFLKRLTHKNGKEKIQAIYNYVAKKTSYSTSSSQCSTAYGALVRGKASCSGYAEAFAFLCEKAGIECIIESGYVGSSDVPHAWNMVKCGKTWYMCDVTFGDSANGSKKELKKYFMVKKSSRKYRMRKCKK